MEDLKVLKENYQEVTILPRQCMLMYLLCIPQGDKVSLALSCLTFSIGNVTMPFFSYYFEEKL